MKGTPAILRAPLPSLPTETVETLAMKIANLHYKDYPMLFKSIKKSLETNNNEKTLKEREALLYSTRIAKKIREISKPHMGNSN